MHHRFAITLYTSKSTQEEDSEMQLQIGCAVIKRIKRLLEETSSKESSNNGCNHAKLELSFCEGLYELPWSESLASSLGKAINYCLQRYFRPLKKFIVSFYSGTTMFLWHQKKADEETFLMISRWTLGSKIWPQTIHFPSRALMSLLAIVFGHPHQEIHIVLSLAPQVLWPYH